MRVFAHYGENRNERGTKDEKEWIQYERSGGAVHSEARSGTRSQRFCGCHFPAM